MYEDQVYKYILSRISEWNLEITFQRTNILTKFKRVQVNSKENFFREKILKNGFRVICRYTLLYI